MIKIKLKLPTKNIKIARVLPKLFQSYVYTVLNDKEHIGYKHPNGKIFKSMNFKIYHKDDEINISYVAIDKTNEKLIAQDILSNNIKLGAIHIVRTDISVLDRDSHIKNSIKAGGFVSAAIKDGTSKNKIYIEPKTQKFQEILYNNTIQKYEALFSKPYNGDLKIKLINQKPNGRIFHYSKGTIKAWYGVYEIEADTDMLSMILDSGMGADCMKGLGFVEIVR